jgi:hypothetical protein
MTDFWGICPSKLQWKDAGMSYVGSTDVVAGRREQRGHFYTMHALTKPDAFCRAPSLPSISTVPSAPSQSGNSTI